MIWAAEILLTVAAILKALADTVDHHFDTSIFRRYNAAFWDRDVSEDKARHIFGYKIDAWHIALSGMIVAMISAVTLHTPKLNWWQEVLIGGAWWNVVFNLFYNKIFILKKYWK